MWINSRCRSVICSSGVLLTSEPDPAARERRTVRVVLLAAALFATAVPASAKIFMTQAEALSLAFGAGATPERKTAYLTEGQAARILASAGTGPSSRVVVYFTGGPDPNRPITAWFDTHIVRTLPEAVMIVIGADGKILRVDVLSFDEPEDYLPKKRWFDQFQGRPLDDDLSTKGAIRAVTGATLSSRSIAGAVRRALATHSVVTTTQGAGEP